MSKAAKTKKPQPASVRNEAMSVNDNTATQKPPFAINFERLLWPVFALYLLAMIYGLLNHESWADEAQSWLLVRDTGLSQLFGILPSEGHPPLWYLFLFPLVKVGLPYVSIKWLSVAIMALASYILMFKTNLPILLRLLLPFSYFFFFQYSILARSYCLIVLFTALIIMLYPKRFEKPWLFALCVVGLFNTHMLIFTFAIGITMLYLIDAVQYKKFSSSVIGSFIFMCIGGLYLIPYLTNTETAKFYANKITDHGGLISRAISNGLLMTDSILGIAFFFILVLLLAKRTKPLLLLLCGLSGIFYILGFRYKGAARHEGVLFIIFLAVYGLAEYYKDEAVLFLKGLDWDLTKYAAWMLCLAIIVQIPSSISAYRDDISGMYSGSKEAAEYIMDNHLENKIIVGQQALSASAVLPYLPRHTQFYYAECERYGTYYVFDSCFIKEKLLYSPGFGVNAAHEHFKDSLDKVIFLFNRPVEEQLNQYLDLLYSTSETPIRWDEKFYIYKFKEGVK